MIPERERGGGLSNLNNYFNYRTIVHNLQYDPGGRLSVSVVPVVVIVMAAFSNSSVNVNTMCNNSPKFTIVTIVAGNSLS